MAEITSPPADRRPPREAGRLDFGRMLTDAPSGARDAPAHHAIDPAWIPLATALLPFLTAHLCYALATAQQLVPLCLPYLQGCTSISAAGRYGWSYFLFKAGVIPAAVLLAIFWWLCRGWLRLLGESADSVAARTMAWIGSVAAAFLVLYAVFLGSQGETYNLLRRYGVSIYFSFSYLAQLILLARLRRLKGLGLARIPAWIINAKTTLAVILLVLGIASIPVSNLFADKDGIENAIEWNFSLLLVLYYLLTWRAWRATGFRLVGGTRDG
jgi:hypothetical protein